jgi:Ca2+-binding EF-hand superfamily protein
MADKMDERLRADLCGDMGKLRGLLAAAGGGGDPAAVLERARILTAINECPTIAKKTDLVQAALERADTDGTGSKMSVATALQQLSQHLLDEMDAAHVAAVQEACKNKRAALVEQTEARGSGGFVEAHMLRAMLQSAPFELQADVVGSVLRFFGVRDEAGDSVRTSEIMRKLCPMLDQAIFAGINAQVIDKYGSLKTAFDALSKDGKISRAQMSELIETLQMEPVGLRWVKLISSKAPSGTRITNARLEEGLQTKVRFLRAEFEQFGLSNLSQDSFIEVNGKFYKPLVNQKLRPNEVQDIVNLADADGSGSIEYQEFQIVFGAGEMFARQRQENYKKLQDKAAQTASVRTDSLFPIGSQAETSLGARMLSPEERVAEVILGPRESELRAALKDADSEGKGSVDTHKLQGAFNKLGLGLSAEDVKKLLSKAVMSDQTGVDYSKLIQEVLPHLESLRRAPCLLPGPPA